MITSGVYNITGIAWEKLSKVLPTTSEHTAHKMTAVTGIIFKIIKMYYNESQLKHCLSKHSLKAKAVEFNVFQHPGF